jgi:ribA/ribD-fused uncharacterized protein
MKTDKYTLFYNGVFSQWWRSNFIIDNITYSSAEQYMMAQKALLFEDKESYDKIMSTTSPSEQKAFGKLVKGFVKETWEAECKDIVFRGNYAKFTQNEHLYSDLMETIGTELVEASPVDPIWGIGLTENDPRAWEKETWQGTNWLGEAVTAVRDKLIEESKSDALIS